MSCNNPIDLEVLVWEPVITAGYPPREDRYWNASSAKSTSVLRVLRIKQTRKLSRKCIGGLLCAPNAIWKNTVNPATSWRNRDLKKAPAKTDAFFQFNSKLNGVFFFVQHFLLIRADITNTIYSTKTLYSAKPGKLVIRLSCLLLNCRKFCSSCWEYPTPRSVTCDLPKTSTSRHLAFCRSFIISSTFRTLP